MDKWGLAELKAHQYYAEKGYRILLSLVETEAFDFVAYKDGEYLQVNVKLATLKGNGKYCVSKAGNSSGKLHKPDIFLVYFVEHDNFIEFNNTLFDGISSKAKTLPVEKLKECLGP